ncbi:MAG: hypothetical protein E6H08_14225 [Bacteroidetes bacterium]|nr:MAG: hypothetical protein E6H08_14225 [Bacteroidota bacterium]
MADDMEVDEYIKELRELKASLIGFATNIEHEELLYKALDIPEQDFTSVDREKSGPLKKHLIEVDSILGICAIYLKAIL